MKLKHFEDVLDAVKFAVGTCKARNDVLLAATPSTLSAVQRKLLEDQCDDLVQVAEFLDRFVDL